MGEAGGVVGLEQLLAITALAAGGEGCRQGVLQSPQGLVQDRPEWFAAARPLRHQ